MEGIIDLGALPNNGESGSPSSGFESSNPSSGLCSDVSVHRHPHPHSHPHPHHDYHHHTPSSYSNGIFSNPFQPPAFASRRRIAPPAFDGRKISPKSRPSMHPTVRSNEGPIEDGGSPWTAPESWAVEKNDDVPQYSSSDETEHGNLGSRKSRRRTYQAPRSLDESSRILDLRGSEKLYKIRIYRVDNTYHITSADLNVTVKQLSKQLNKKFRLDAEREPHRLYLKERGRGEFYSVVLKYGDPSVISERMLALTEKPILIVRRRLAQAGYDTADGLDMLGAEDIQFLMKFVYKSNVLGPAVCTLLFLQFLYSFILRRRNSGSKILRALTSRDEA